MARLTRILQILRHTRGKDGPYTVDLPEDEWPVEEWPVYGVAPGRPDEPFERGREPVGEMVTVYAPLSGPRPGPKDRVRLNGESWQVDGGVAEWTENPVVNRTTYDGVVVVLRRWEG